MSEAEGTPPHCGGKQADARERGVPPNVGPAESNAIQMNNVCFQRLPPDVDAVLLDEAWPNWLDVTP